MQEQKKHGKDEKGKNKKLRKGLRALPFSPFHDRGDTTHVPKDSMWAQSQGIMPGHDESRSSQQPSLQAPSWLRGARTPQGRVLRQINHGGQSKVIGLREDKEPECYSFIKDLTFPKLQFSL